MSTVRAGGENESSGNSFFPVSIISSQSGNPCENTRPLSDFSVSPESHRTGRGPRSPLTAHVTPAEPALSLGPETQHTRAYDAWSVSCPINCWLCVALRFRLYFATLADFSAGGVPCGRNSTPGYWQW